ncbi:MAG: hypothetical protein JJE09_00435 [Bacteroidia bacterium]|nr:hypothetical protein [Bacteroidia bacterium]
MILRAIYILSILSLFAVDAIAQKVKYKDLFILLNAKNYDQAEPFLKKYLKDNDDNPNAYLFMGSIYQENAAKKDILMHTDLMLSDIDSAVFFYHKANIGLTEKEIKRNDEYYEAYSRRDLRTGKFEIKLSDVKFDVEKKIQSLNDRKEKIKKMKLQYQSSEAAYEKVRKDFISVQDSFPGIKEFYLRSNPKLMEKLKTIGFDYDAFLVSFNDYKATSKELGRTGYNQVLDQTDIQDFKKDGASPADFAKDDLKIWDYKRWALYNLGVIEKEVTPMLETLINYDIEINKLREKLMKDSVSIANDLTQLMDKLLNSSLKKFDSDPLPMAIFGMKVSELEYNSILIKNKPLKDSANVNLLLQCLELEFDALHKMDSLANSLTERSLEKDEENYRHFIVNAYGSLTVLKNYVRATREYAIREKMQKENEWEATMQALKWIVDGSDSIPLFSDALQLNYRYKPLIIVEDDHTAGLSITDKDITGYFYTIISSHLPDIKVSFPVDKKSFTATSLPVTKGFSAKDVAGQVYFVLLYSESKQADKFPVTLAKIYRTDGLAWSFNYLFDMVPSELLYKSDTGELLIKISNSAGDSNVIDIDKNGKIVQ